MNSIIQSLSLQQAQLSVTDGDVDRKFYIDLIPDAKFGAGVTQFAFGQNENKLNL